MYLFVLRFFDRDFDVVWRMTSAIAENVNGEDLHRNHSSRIPNHQHDKNGFKVHREIAGCGKSGLQETVRLEA